ncbi:MAG: hypothetical protein HC893_03320, partial [Chloroflexaceae bacterium]|nr:hypothetical protein [Chloroflexaceae bacterium]
FVTNGLLPIEMMTGQLQVGENELRPAPVPTLRRLATLATSRPTPICRCCTTVSLIRALSRASR